MAIVTMKQLLEAGVHFGHQARRWNPKMQRYIFGERNGVYIIDLQKTVQQVNTVYHFVREIIEQGESILFVGTKRQAQEVVREQAQRCGMFYVTNRWLGGTLTNFETIKKSIRRLKRIEKMEQEGTFGNFTKKEIGRLLKEKAKLDKNLSGLKDMAMLPGAIFIIDTKKEAIAVAEANKLKIPSIGIVDTNCDPDEITYPIPGNDDAIRSIKLFTTIISDAVLDAKARVLEGKEVPGTELGAEIAEKDRAVLSRAGSSVIEDDSEEEEEPE
ncbi:MAG: 30S ribosomal protein S2 [Candidatus Abyssobacteria bacterium SURF_5]|uniref:Small ribosomal subunit protein uS2 n=1 Tax=Abyssobacteria bacterium (strain SURF_5) TaxID=2093360 RepID=A0A3A4P6S3_ABYX5|nr:MAG: 30S ribosomal protein S2 [Candidatus Abyssubacteria bacterium SURF_5]